MTRIIRSAEPQGAGYIVTVEVTDAYTDGTSRFDRVYVARDEMRGRTPAERRQAVLEAIDDDPVADIVGDEVVAPTVTRDILERRMEATYADWQRWKTTREEAQVRALAANVINAITARESAAWAEYLDILQMWRKA